MTKDDNDWHWESHTLYQIQEELEHPGTGGLHSSQSLSEDAPAALSIN